MSNEQEIKDLVVELTQLPHDTGELDANSINVARDTVSELAELSGYTFHEVMHTPVVIAVMPEFLWEQLHEYICCIEDYVSSMN